MQTCGRGQAYRPWISIMTMCGWSPCAIILGYWQIWFKQGFLALSHELLSAKMGLPQSFSHYIPILFDYFDSELDIHKGYGRTLSLVFIIKLFVIYLLFPLRFNRRVALLSTQQLRVSLDLTLSWYHFYSLIAKGKWFSLMLPLALYLQLFLIIFNIRSNQVALVIECTWYTLTHQLFYLCLQVLPPCVYISLASVALCGGLKLLSIWLQLFYSDFLLIYISVTFGAGVLYTKIRLTTLDCRAGWVLLQQLSSKQSTSPQLLRLILIPTPHWHLHGHNNINRSRPRHTLPRNFTPHWLLSHHGIKTMLNTSQYFLIAVSGELLVEVGLVEGLPAFCQDVVQGHWYLWVAIMHLWVIILLVNCYINTTAPKHPTHN